MNTGLDQSWYQLFASICVLVDRLDQAIADHQVQVQISGQMLKTACYINSISNYAVLKPAFVANIAGDHRAIVESDANPHGRFTFSDPFRIPVFQRCDHIHRALQCICRVLRSGIRRPECRHQAIANILV